MVPCVGWGGCFGVYDDCLQEKTKEASWMSYSLDGQNNVTLTETTLNLTES
jgi:hypothetical protein